MNVKILRCHHISLFKVADKHYETESFMYVVHAQLKIFARSVKVITLYYKQHKNGLSSSKGIKCECQFLVSISLMFFRNMLRCGWHASTSQVLLLCLFPANSFFPGTRSPSHLFLIFYLSQIATQFPLTMIVTMVKATQNGLCNLFTAWFFFGLHLSKGETIGCPIINTSRM